MPRTRTDAAERTAQNNKLQAEMAGVLGANSITLQAAKKVRDKVRSVVDITPRELDLSDAEVLPVGLILARVTDYKITNGVNASLSLVTNAYEFGDVLHDAARLSHSDLLVAALFRIPRRLGLDDEPDEDE
jgi:hypothetical protein